MIDTKKSKSEPKTETKAPKKPASKFGVLGKDLSSKFSSRTERTWRPTKSGGRNPQGKP